MTKTELIDLLRQVDRENEAGENCHLEGKIDGVAYPVTIYFVNGDIVDCTDEFGTSYSPPLSDVLTAEIRY